MADHAENSVEFRFDPAVSHMETKLVLVTEVKRLFNC